MAVSRESSNTFIPILNPDDPDIHFPPASQALADPPGLLAIGGDLRPDRVLLAYRSGIFPWYETSDPILWWSPDPRFVWLPGWLHLPKRLARTILQCHGQFTLTIDRDFKNILMQCGPERKGSPGTWITEAMVQSYLDLNDLGYAHSIELQCNSNSYAGIIGLAIGGVFFAESMFTIIQDGSKILLWALLSSLFRAGFSMVDCQVESAHVCALGAQGITRDRYLAFLAQGITLDRVQFWNQPILTWPEPKSR
ncbi:MAG: leucyl/phenylalanyl-tRNA--protein transferase [Gammaproteobacteria bacterium]